MKLYPKKIRNLKGLEQEKKKLLKAKRDLHNDGILSLDGILSRSKSGKKDDADEAGGGLESIFAMLKGSNPWMDMVMGFVQSRFAQKDKGDKYEDTGGKRRKKKDNSLLATVAKEFIGGYLKWKAIELSYKGIKLIIKMRRDKKRGEEPEYD